MTNGVENPPSYSCLHRNPIRIKVAPPLITITNHLRMKRLVWLLILVFGTALAQVPPVELGAQSQPSCSCCDVPGACGMPDCGQAPSAAPSSFAAERPAGLTSLATRGKATHLYRSAPKILFSEKTSAGAVMFCSGVAGTGETVPLFKAHCSYLI